MRASKTWLLASALLGLLSGCTGQAQAPTVVRSAASASSQADGTSSCAGRATSSQTEGPFFRVGSPKRRSLLEPGLPGTRLTLTGRVLTLSCQPVAGALLDFWQADSSGLYDDHGYRLRGHQLADTTGRYLLQTILPGEYAGRAPHVHVKVQTPDGRVLTTQLYLPGAKRNQQDPIFDPTLVLSMTESLDGKLATFDFVLDQR